MSGLQGRVAVERRNPGLGREDLERVLAEALGARKVIWLGAGIAGDDTHGHVDDLCRFVAPGRVVLRRESDPGDANYRPLEENRERLQGARDASGSGIEVIPLPMPRPLALDGQRLPASYANFYVANAAVLVPTFNDPADREALGTLHCLTQQQPAP